MTTGRFGAPPSAAEVKNNITTPTPAPDGADKNRFINFRVTNELFIEIKTAALREGMTLGDYLIQTHRTYQAKK